MSIRSRKTQQGLTQLANLHSSRPISCTNRLMSKRKGKDKHEHRGAVIGESAAKIQQQDAKAISPAKTQTGATVSDYFAKDMNPGDFEAKISALREPSPTQGTRSAQSGQPTSPAQPAPAAPFIV